MYFAWIDQYELALFGDIIFAITIKAIGAFYHKFYYVMIMKVLGKTMMRQGVRSEIDIKQLLISPQGKFSKRCLRFHNSKIIKQERLYWPFIQLTGFRIFTSLATTRRRKEVKL